MNDRLPTTNATSLPTVSALPESWIAKIFAKFEARYGSLFLDRWRDCNMSNVMQTWAEELSGFADQPERISYALQSLADERFPPTLPEFIAACRKAPAKPSGPALAYKPTPEDEERSRQAAEQASRVVKRRASDGIDTFWATHPKTHAQLKLVFEAAAKDQRFSPCVAEMVADGICTEDGHLLKLYRDGQWYPVSRKAA